MSKAQWRNDSDGEHPTTRKRIYPIATFSTKILQGLSWNRTRVSGVRRSLNYSEFKSGNSSSNSNSNSNNNNNNNNNTFYVMHLGTYITFTP
jgi:hypothetical protein